MNWNELNELELETQLAILETEKATSQTQRRREPFHRLRAILKTERDTEHFGTGSPNRTQKAELGTQGALLGT